MQRKEQNNGLLVEADGSYDFMRLEDALSAWAPGDAVYVYMREKGRWQFWTGNGLGAPRTAEDILASR